MVNAGCVFVASIHPSRTWISGSFESMRWNACVHRLDLGLYSHPRELLFFFFFWNGVSTHINSRGKPLPQEKFSSEEDRTHDAASHRPASSTHYQLSYPTPPPPPHAHTHQCFENWIPGGWPARLLAFYCHCWDWWTHCQYSVTGWDRKSETQLLNLCLCVTA